MTVTGIEDWLVGLAAVVVRVGTGPVVSNDPDRAAAVLGLPATSVAAPAGSCTTNVPSATRARSNVNVRPSPAATKFVTVPFVVATSATSNPVTGSENVTVSGTDGWRVKRAVLLVSDVTGAVRSNDPDSEPDRFGVPSASTATPAGTVTANGPSPAPATLNV